MDAKRVFMQYADRFERSSKMELKIVHTMAVAEIMDELTQKLGLPERTAFLAHLCAIFHDIGRFEQLKRFDTFLDHKSVDHAQLGVQILQEERLLDGLEAEEKEKVLTAVGNHNKLSIDPEVEGEALLLSRLIRDADKCDIFRVVATEDMVDTIGKTQEQVAGELISDAVYESIMNHVCVPKEKRETGPDMWVSFLGFFFDFNFTESIEIAQRQGYYRKPFERVRFTRPETVQRMEDIFREFDGYLRMRMEGGEERA